MFYPVNAFLSSDIDNIAAKRHPSQTSARIANNSEPARETFFEDNRRPARSAHTFCRLDKTKTIGTADGFGVGCGELWSGSADVCKHPLRQLSMPAALFVCYYIISAEFLQEEGWGPLQ